MFMLRQYAACVLVVAALGALILVSCGIGYMLKTAGTMILRALLDLAFRRFGQDSEAMSGRAAVRTEPSLVTEA
jgi:hypothetical protein